MIRVLLAAGCTAAGLSACATAPAAMNMEAASLAPPHAPIVEGRAVPVVAHSDHAMLLASDDPALAANKRLAYDLWRSVLNAGHVEVADQLLTEDYIQHNPTAPTGREAFKAIFSSFVPRRETIPEQVEDPLVTIVAAGDFVVMAFVDEREEADGSGTYTTTHFDLFRVENGRIAEHWDSAMRPAGLDVPSVEDGGPLPVTGVEGVAQHDLLQSDDPELAANKRLVFDLWRHTVEAGREEVADLYLDPIYIQHNPNAATGREGFREYMSNRPDRPIEIAYRTPIVAIVAEGDLVAQAIAEERPIPGGDGELYSLTHFDLFRIEDGRIIEHWDNAGRGELPPDLQAQQ